ncbi:hypothetical protein B0H63DRAFT_519667 [Podospora didyma]|uniref:Uncharacterized protein n=1 Tax=Podospora didyma TaxID=330526 RepID=A0AAE0NZ74_9PEZI|nr:hypothetical protein B0H63DRAFT_519667 [Podospora didyma]
MDSPSTAFPQTPDVYEHPSGLNFPRAGATSSQLRQSTVAQVNYIPPRATETSIPEFTYPPPSDPAPLQYTEQPAPAVQQNHQATTPETRAKSRRSLPSGPAVQANANSNGFELVDGISNSNPDPGRDAKLYSACSALSLSGPGLAIPSQIPAEQQGSKPYTSPEHIHGPAAPAQGQHTTGNNAGYSTTAAISTSTSVPGYENYSQYPSTRTETSSNRVAYEPYAHNPAQAVSNSGTLQHYFPQTSRNSHSYNSNQSSSTATSYNLSSSNNQQQSQSLQQLNVRPPPPPAPQTRSSATSTSYGQLPQQQQPQRRQQQKQQQNYSGYTNQAQQPQQQQQNTAGANGH